MADDRGQMTENIRERMSRIMEDMQRDILSSVCTGGTSDVTNASETGEAFSMEKLEYAMDLLETCRPERIVYLVSTFLSGPPVEWRPQGYWRKFTGADVQIFMSVEDARKHHEEWPLKLVRPLNKYAALYEPLSGFPGDVAPAVLPLPPFDLMQGGTDD
jgi:hypothetical protein